MSNKKTKTVILLMLTTLTILIAKATMQSFDININEIDKEENHPIVTGYTNNNDRNFIDSLSDNQKRSLASSFISCTNEGVCTRSDGVLLKLGWVPKVPNKDYDDVFDTDSKDIISLNPFTNTTSLTFIKGSKKYTCADGVNECFNSCCSKGLCTDPSNVCTTALKSSKARIYVTCIIYALVAIVYWVAFGYIGARYAKSKASVFIDVGNKKERKENLINENNESIRSRGMSALDNFDDRFNSGYENNNTGNNPNFNPYGYNNNNFSNFTKNNIDNKDNNAVNSNKLGNNNNNNNIQDISQNSYEEKFNQKYFQNKEAEKNIELENKNKILQTNNKNKKLNNDGEIDGNNFDDHILDQEIEGKNSQPVNSAEISNINDDSEFQVKDLDY